MAGILGCGLLFAAWFAFGDLAAFFRVETVGAAACPITDGGVGDDDATTDGTVTISSTKTFTSSSTLYDCTATAFHVTSSGTLVLDGSPTTGLFAEVKFGTLTVDAGGKISADGEGCIGGPDNYTNAPSTTTNVCAQVGGTGWVGSGGASGGSHAGLGGLGSSGAARNSTYGSSVTPRLFGASGAGTGPSHVGGNGGGVVKFTVTGTFTLNGIVSTNGTNGTASGSNAASGGAGGSMLVNAGIINGTGTFEAKGGNGADSTSDGGGGSGGRIAVYYNATGSTFSFGPTKLVVSGGTATGTAQAGANGTAFLDDDNGTLGTTGDDDISTYHGFTWTDTDFLVASWTADAGNSNQHCDPSIASSATPSVVASGAVIVAGTTNCTQAISSLTYTSTSGAVTLAASASSTVSGGQSYFAATTLTVGNSSTVVASGAMNFSAGSSFSIGSGVTISNGGRDTNIDFNIPPGDNQTWTNLTLTGAAEGDFTVDDAVAITLAGTTTINASVVWPRLTAFTMNSGTTLSANGKGCQDIANQWARVPNSSNVCDQVSPYGWAGSGGSSGGSHGGLGGVGSSSIVVNPAYDSSTAPVLYGSSGAGVTGAVSGSNGGGLVRIHVNGNVTLNGNPVTANGANGFASGANAVAGGAGGSVYISATGSVSGSVASFAAKGGNGGDSTGDGGGGGGGRIALIYGSTSLTLSSLLFDVAGGTATGTANPGVTGTVYARNATSNAVNVYHGFTYEDADLSASSWTFDSSVAAQTCLTSLSSTASPSISALGNLTSSGSVTCSPSISSLTLSAGGTVSLPASATFSANSAIVLSGGTGFTLGSSATVTSTKSGANITFNVPPGSSQTWTNVTISTSGTGTFVLDDAFSLTLAGTTTVNGNVRWSNLANLTQNSGAVISANSRGCLGQPNNYIFAPNASNVCTSTSTGWTNSGGATGASHGGSGGTGTSAVAANATYGSATVPALYGASGGSTSGALGGNGGGTIRIQVTGTFTHDGVVRANGTDGAVSSTTHASGGGSGGSAHFTVGTYACTTGTFAVAGGNGGDNSAADGGGGSGGRVSVEYTADTSGGCPLSGLSAAGVAPGGLGPDTANDGASGTLSLTAPAPTSCPIVDGGVGDDDSTVDGTVTVSASKTFNASSTPYDCTASTVHVTSTGTINLSGNSSTGAIAEVTFGVLTVDAGGKISADGRGCVGVSNDYIYGPNASNICVNTSTGHTSGTNFGSAGGSHGGKGGSGTGPILSNAVYGSSVTPALFGSSGGSTNNILGSAGGGVVKITVTGTFTHNGLVSANGNNGTTGASGQASGGGAGGSILLRAGVINGTTGTFEAKGGDGGNNTGDGGGGGGGRVAIYFNATGSSYSFDAADISIAGGAATGSATAGAAGTAFLDDDNGSPDATGDDDIRIFYGFTWVDTDFFVATWTVDPSTSNQHCDASISSSATPSVNANGAIVFDGTLNCTQAISGLSYSSATGTVTITASSSSTVNGGQSFSAATVLTIGNSSVVASTGALTMAAGTDFAMGTGVTLTNGGRNTDIVFDIPPGDNQTWTDATITGPTEGDLSIDDAVAITLAGTTTVNASVNWPRLTAFTMNSGTTLSANGKGCASGINEWTNVPNSANVCAQASPYGWAGSGGASGGSYGGAAGLGSSSATVNPVYGSSTAPALYGASGGGIASSFIGGHGGGLIRINVYGPMTLNGNPVTASGGNGIVSSPNASGGGAGGAIYLTVTGALGGSVSSIAAKGGNGGDSTGDGGAGGGGRIALVYGSTTLTLSSTLFDVAGGTATGSAQAGQKGTVYARNASTDAVAVYHGFTYEDADLSASSWTFDSSVAAQACLPTLASTASPSITTSGNLISSGNVTCSISVSSLSLSAAGALTIPASAATSVNGAITLAAGTSFSLGSGASVVSTKSGADITFDVPSGNAQTWTNATVTTVGAGDFILDDAFALTLAGTTTVNANVNWTNLASLTQDSGSTINASGRGCTGQPNHYIFAPNASNVCGQTGTGWTNTGGATGASHGGTGGTGTSSVAANATYGSASVPVLFGASGGSTSGALGGNGGGVIRIHMTGSFTHNGTITVSGTNGNIASTNHATGGAAGGSMYVTTNAYSCATGTFSAAGGNGGNNSAADGGGGAGGRVSVEYGSTSGTCTLTGLTAAGVAPGGSGPDAANDGASGTLTLTFVAPPPSPPVITSVTHSPASPLATDQVTISGTATDETGVTKIELYLDGTAPANLVRTCLFSPAEASASCFMNVGVLSNASHTTTVRAYDATPSSTDGAETFAINGQTMTNGLSLGRHKAGATNVAFSLTFTLAATESGTLTVTFPVGFTVTSAAQAGQSSGCLSSFGSTSSTLTATKTSCSGTVTLGGAAVTNPVTTGIYVITWSNDSGSGSVVIIDDDQVTVSGDVEPQLTFNVGSQTGACDGTFSGSGGALGLGALTSASVGTSDSGGVPHVCTRVTSNAGGGAVVSVLSAFGALRSAATPADQIVSSTATLVAGTAGYGMCAGSSVGDAGRDATTPAGATPSAAAPFASSCTTSAHSVGALTTSFQSLWTISGPSQNAFFRIFLKAAVSPATPAHADYADTLTFIATGTY